MNVRGRDRSHPARRPRSRILRPVVGAIVSALCLSLLHVQPATAAASAGTMGASVGYGCGGLAGAADPPGPSCWYSGGFGLPSANTGTFHVGSFVYAGEFWSYWYGTSPSENLASGSGALSIAVAGTDPLGQSVSGQLDGTYLRAGRTLTAPLSGSLTVSGPNGTATGTVSVQVTADMQFKPYDLWALTDPYGADVNATYEETSLPPNQPPTTPTRVAPPNGHEFQPDAVQLFTVRSTDPENAPYKARITVRRPDGSIEVNFDTAYAASGADAIGTPPWKLGRGSYTWTAVAVDPWGAESSASSQGSFTVAPTIEPLPPEADGPTTRVSLATTGEQGDDRTYAPAVSGDGRIVAFASAASNLVPGDTNGVTDIFVRDRGIGVTTRVSVATGGAQANSWSSTRVAISADDRYVAFSSAATNLVGGDINGKEDVFVHDRASGTTERVSVGGGGVEAGNDSENPSISADGRYVAFQSPASNLVSGDTNGWTDIFVRDRVAGTTVRASTGDSGVEGTDGATEPSISADGRYVAFQTYAGNLKSGEWNFWETVYVRDLVTGVTTRAAASTTGGLPNTHTRYPKLSSDGRYVLFHSYATDIVAGDGGVTDDIFLRDRTTGTTSRVNLDSAGRRVEAFSGQGFSMSGDARFVAFADYSSSDIHVRDRTTGTTTQVSMDSWGLDANGQSSGPVVSDDGRYAAFASFASNLVHADTNLERDVFVHDLAPSRDCTGEGSTPGVYTPVGCVAGYGAHAASSRQGLEDFMPYRPWELGTGTAYANMFNGNLVVQHTDLDAPGQGLNLRMTRTYNLQQAGVDGPLGKGWRLGIADGDGLIEGLLQAVTSVDVGRIVRIVGTEDQFDFIDADGTKHHFIKGGLDGPGWHSPPGINLVLSDHLDGGGNRWYKATRPDGVHYEFRPVALKYFLTKIADRKGNEITFNYTAGTDPVLSSISDTVGRSLVLTWSGNYVSNIRYNADGSWLDTSYTMSGGKLTAVTEAAGTGSARTTGYGYDADDRLVSVTDPRSGTTSFGHTNGQLNSVTDRAGKTWGVAYTGVSCVPSVGTGTTAMCLTDPEGNASAWTSNADGNPVHVRDAGDQTEGGAPRRNDRQYVWRDNRLAKEVDEAGNVKQYEYNANGQVTEVRDTGSVEPTVVTRLTYQAVSPGVADLTKAQVAFGTAEERVTTFANNADGTLASTTDAEGKTTSFTYYVRGLLKTVVDANNKATTYGNSGFSDGEYHSSGQPRRITDATGATKEFVFDFLGRNTQVTDRNAKVWNHEYDLRGNRTRETTPLGHATVHCYDANDNEVLTTRPKATSPTCSMTEADPYVTRRTYDGRDLLTGVHTKSDAQLRKTAYAYADDGELKEIVEPRSFDTTTGALLPTVQKVTYERYPNNRVSAFLDEEGNRTDVVYTPDGLHRTVTKPTGGTARHTTTYAYNGRGQVRTQLELGHSQPTTHTYNLHGHKVSTKTPKGATTTSVYDRMGRITRSVDGNGKLTRRVYDNVGNLLTLATPKDTGGELVTNYLYTARNEIDYEYDPADSSHTIDYDYDGEGNQRFRRDWHGGTIKRTTEQTYFDDGKLSQKTASFTGTTTGKHVTAYGYDANGNANSMTATLDGAASPNVSSVTVTHTTADEPATWNETLWNPSGTGVTKTSSWSYLPDGLVASRTNDGQTTNYTVKRNGWEEQTTPWGGAGSLTTEYFADGSVKKQTLPGNTTIEQTFDAADRMTSRVVRKSGGTVLAAWERIVWDDDDDRLAEQVRQLQTDNTTVREGTGTYGYDTGGRMTQAKHPFEDESVSYALDDAGNIVTETDFRYTYTHNKLTSRQALPSGPTWSYGHDPYGNQVSETTGTSTTSTTYDAASHSRRVTSPDGSWVEYAYDGHDRMVRRQESTGTVTLFFHDGSSQEIALETDGAGTAKTRYVLDADGEAVANETIGTGGRGWYVEDPRGNLNQHVDNSGVVKGVFAYDPFGKEKPGLTSKAAGWDSRLRFQMAPRDPKTGMYSLGPRLLDPTINRFVGADQYVAAAANMELALDPLTGNRYLYAGANPAKLIDDGHKPFWKRALKRVRGIARAVALVPGPVGTIAGGVALASSAALGDWRGAAADVGFLAAGAVGGRALAQLGKTRGLAKIQQGLPGVGANSGLFGRHGRGLLNSNDVVRVGWSWRGSATGGYNSFGIRLGSQRGPIHWHFPIV